MRESEREQKETIKIHEHCSLLPRILIVIEKKKKKEFFAFFYFNHSLKSNRTITNFSFSVFFSFLDILIKTFIERARERKTIMADDDDLDMNSMNDLSSSSFPPVTLSNIEKVQDDEDKQQIEGNINNQVDLFFFFFFFVLLK